jgi:hypothetical protein
MAECIGVLSALSFSLVEEFDLQKQQRSMLGRSLHLVIYSELQGFDCMFITINHFSQALEEGSGNPIPSPNITLFAL